MEDQHIQYTIVVNGKPEGPYRLEQLSTKYIHPETFVRKPGMDDYKEAHEFAELRELFGFSYQITAPQYFASFDQRLMASVIDYFFILLAYVFLALISFIFIDNKADRIVVSIAGLPLIPIAKLIYGTVTEAAEKQGGLGKRLMNIKVTDMTGKRLTFRKSFGRNTAKILSVIPAFSGYLYSFLNKKQQCLHDLISDTLVIKDRLI